MSFGNIWTPLECRITEETDKAFLLEVEFHGPVWVTKREISDPGDYRIGHQGFVSVKTWLVERLGIQV